MALQRAQLNSRRLYSELDRRMGLEDEGWETYLMRIRGVEFNEFHNGNVIPREQVAPVLMLGDDAPWDAQRVPRALSLRLDGDIEDIPFGLGECKASGTEPPPQSLLGPDAKGQQSIQGASWDSFMADIYGKPQSTANPRAKSIPKAQAGPSEEGISDSFMADVYGAGSKKPRDTGKQPSPVITTPGSPIQAVHQPSTGMSDLVIHEGLRKQDGAALGQGIAEVSRQSEGGTADSFMAEIYGAGPKDPQKDKSIQTPQPSLRRSAGSEYDSFMGDVYGAGAAPKPSHNPSEKPPSPAHVSPVAQPTSGGVPIPSSGVPPSNLRYLMAEETRLGLIRNESQFSIPGIRSRDRDESAMEGSSGVQSGPSRSNIELGREAPMRVSSVSTSYVISLHFCRAYSATGLLPSSRTGKRKVSRMLPRDGLKKQKSILGSRDGQASVSETLSSLKGGALDSLPIDVDGAGPSAPRRSSPVLAPQSDEPSAIEDFSRIATAPPRLTTQRKAYSAVETSLLTTPGDSPAVRRTVTFAAGAQMLRAPLAISGSSTSSTSAITGKGKGKASMKKLASLMPPPVVTLRANTSRQALIKKGKGKGKEPVVHMTAAEYAQTLQSKPVVPATAAVSGGDSQRKWRHLLLKGFTFFYVSGELTYASQSTKKRMDYIHCRGGVVLSTYDPELVTHIIVDTANPDKPDAGVTLRTLGLKKLGDIPDHVPTVKWKWVNSAKVVPNGDRAGNFRKVADGNGGYVTVRMDWEFMHSAFIARVHAGKGFKNTEGNEKDKGKGKTKPKTAAQRKEGENSEEEDNDSAADISDISNFTQDAPSPPPSAAEPPTYQSTSFPNEQEICNKSDPLGEFEALAKAEKEAELARERELASEFVNADPKDPTSIHQPSHGTHNLQGFLCDAPKSNSPTSNCPNQDIVDKLEALMELHRAKPTEEDKWRVYSYSKSIRKLRIYPHRITSYDEARNIPGIGDKTALKIKEILETGELRRIEIEHTDDLDVVNLFQGIYGVGQHIAYMWYSAGCRTLDNIRERKNGIKVSDVQEIGLKYYNDINTRMPRVEAGEIFTAIKRIAVSIDPHLYIEIMGSYRRGKVTCGDIDILITRPTDDGNTHEGVLITLLSALQHEGIIREYLSMPDFKDDPLEAVYRGLCIRPLREGEDHDTKRLMRRIDILTVPYKSRGAALIYYTGDDIFNRSLRLKANKMGYSLNQRGLFAGVVRSTENKMIKTCDGHIIASESEEEIFGILGVPWQEPWERVRS
ncbi:hypothetical protein EVG20_g6972 [Dentipellis fragilis]|uniref:DNA polymerase lambda n=1 Tax=Dentipellis fragilis TaxID=205917 RepID=A0A4Y9YI46_9AGAM|nr:hypothetical protein EVG20_g6972 [Dentipellis fragilis]